MQTHQKLKIQHSINYSQCCWCTFILLCPNSLCNSLIVLFMFCHQFVLLHLRRSMRPQWTRWGNFKRVLVKSCTRNCSREPRPRGTGCVKLQLCMFSSPYHRCPLHSNFFSLLTVSFFFSPAGRMVVRRCISRGPYPLSAERELWRASTILGALLASCRGNSNAEGQY